MRASVLIRTARFALVAPVAFIAASASPSRGTPDASPPPPAAAWFQSTEQALMDAVATGDKAVWERVLDDGFVATSEEGEVIPRLELLAGLRGLPPGLSGGIAVQELTVQDLGDVAVVRFLADEWESVFGQRLATQYRITDTWRRNADSWKLAASHTSVVTRDPPAQSVSKVAWAGYAGRYRLQPDGWTFTVELRDGELWGGRDPQKLRRLVPLAPNAFVVSGSLGEWIFVGDDGGRPTRIVDLRKFEVLIWDRLPD